MSASTRAAACIDWAGGRVLGLRFRRTRVFCTSV
jgi:hypothetical protein